jgi:hypothetical protein
MTDASSNAQAFPLLEVHALIDGMVTLAVITFTSALFKVRRHVLEDGHVTVAKNFWGKILHLHASNWMLIVGDQSFGFKGSKERINVRVGDFRKYTVICASGCTETALLTGYTDLPNACCFLLCLVSIENVRESNISDKGVGVKSSHFCPFLLDCCVNHRTEIIEDTAVSSVRICLQYWCCPNGEHFLTTETERRIYASLHPLLHSPPIAKIYQGVPKKLGSRTSSSKRLITGAFFPMIAPVKEPELTLTFNWRTTLVPALRNFIQGMNSVSSLYPSSLA